MGWFGRNRQTDKSPLSIETVHDKQSFLHFIAALRLDLETNADRWESETLADYFNAIERWTNDWRKFEAAPNPGRHAVKILLAASRYE